MVRVPDDVLSPLRFIFDNLTGGTLEVVHATRSANDVVLPGRMLDTPEKSDGILLGRLLQDPADHATDRQTVMTVAQFDERVAANSHALVVQSVLGDHSS